MALASDGDHEVAMVIKAGVTDDEAVVEGSEENKSFSI
jgi:hypothetical protein